MIVCFSAHSQNTSTITITSDQLRTANLIFAEHKKYSELVPLLEKENSNLLTINHTWERTDSINRVQLKQQKQIISEQCYNIDHLKKSVRTSSIVAGTSIVITVLCLLLK
jgi:hypothetical protein